MGDRGVLKYFCNKVFCFEVFLGGWVGGSDTDYKAKSQFQFD